MGVNPSDMFDRKMEAVTGIGAGYWMVNTPPTGNGVGGVIPTTAARGSGKALPGADAALSIDPGELRGEAAEQRQEQFSKWVAHDDEEVIATAEDEREEPICYMGAATTVDRLVTAPEVWGIAHVCMFAAYWVDLLIVGIWQLVIYTSYRDVSFEASGCETLKIYYATSSVAIFVCVPIVVYVVHGLLMGLREARRIKLKKKHSMTSLSLLSSKRNKPVIDICLAFPWYKLLAVCIAVIASLFVFGWYLAGVLLTLRFTTCGSFHTQGKVIAIFSGSFLTIFAAVIPSNTMFTLYKPVLPPEIHAPNPRGVSPAAPPEEVLQSPVRSGQKALRELEASTPRHVVVES